MSGDGKGGRIAPHNQEAEASVIGALMLDPNRIPEALDACDADDFYDPRHRVLFAALADLADRNIPIDFLTVGEKLRSEGKEDAVGGRPYLIELAGRVTSGAHLAFHLKMVRESSLLRSLIRESTSVITEAYDTTVDGNAVTELIDRTEERILAVGQTRSGSKVESISGAIEETFKRIDASSGRSGLTGVGSGYYDLDEILCGFQKGELIVLAARPSMGKTALALNMLDHAAFDQPEWLEKKPVVLLFSLEMGRQAIASRMLCSRARVDAHRLRTGQMPADDYAELVRAAGEFRDAHLFIDDTAGISIMALRSRARRIKQQHGLEMIVIDYMQLMSHHGSESRQMEISFISRSLKEMARDLDVPVIALSQLSRAVENRESKEPQLSDLRESGSIEQDADVVLLLYRPEYYDRDNEDLRGLAELIIAKQRNGPTGHVTLRFFGSHMRFENRTPEVAETIHLT